MKRYLLPLALLLVWCFPEVHLSATWDKGFDFRSTSGYVTDPANCTYVIDTDSYPTTRNTVTFGWTIAPTSSRDRDNTIDARLAGINFGNSGTFRVDLPATGTYDVHLAIGDAGTNQIAMALTVRDGVSTLISLSGLTTVADHQFFDATGTRYTHVTWPTSETAVNVTAAAATLFVDLGASSSNTTLAHLFLHQTGGGGGGSTPQTLPLLGVGPGQ